MENDSSSINMPGGHMPYSTHANCFTVIHSYLLSRRNIHNTNPSRQKSHKFKKKHTNLNQHHHSAEQKNQCSEWQE